MNIDWWQTINIEDESGMKIGTVRIKVTSKNPYTLRTVRATFTKDKVIIEHSRKFTGYIDQLTLYAECVKSVELKSMINSKKEKMVFT